MARTLWGPACHIQRWLVWMDWTYLTAVEISPCDVIEVCMKIGWQFRFMIHIFCGNRMLRRISWHPTHLLAEHCSGQSYVAATVQDIIPNLAALLCESHHQLWKFQWNCLLEQMAASKKHQEKNWNMEPHTPNPEAKTFRFQSWNLWYAEFVRKTKSKLKPRPRKMTPFSKPMS